VLLAVGFVVWRLAARFPGQINSDFDRARLVQLLAVLALVSSGIIFSGRVRAGELVRGLAMWAALAAALVLAYSFKDELGDIGTRLRSELVPSEPVVSGADMLVLTASEDSHFYVIGEANGTRVRFLIDTGASDIVLNPSDARRIGVDLSALKFSRPYQTANGIGFGAPLTLETLTIRPIVLTNLRVVINQTEMGDALLGMSFLERMESFEVRGRKLVLRWR
jgi:aspartyl protease family protein